MTHFNTDAETLATELAAEQARISQLNSDRYEQGRDDDSFISQKCEQHHLSHMERSLELARMGWRMGFVGLCRLDGTPARGRWIDGKWGSSWMTTDAAGERVFIKTDTIYDSRAGREKATAKLLAMGFRWETRRLPCDCKWFYSGKGFVGLYSGSLVTFPVDADGRETCRDALVYPAESFFVDGAGEMACGMAEGYADLYENGAATVAAANAPRRRSKVAT